MSKKKTVAEKVAKKDERFPACVEMVPLRKVPEKIMFLRHQGGTGTYGPHKVEFDVNINFDCYIVEFADDSKHGRFTLSIHDIIPKAYEAWVRERAAAGDPVPGEGPLLPSAVSQAPAPPGPDEGWRKKARGYQIMSRKMAGMLLLDRLHIDCQEAMRAGGDVECEDCRLPYFEHPQVADMPTFHILCNRKVVKL